MKKIIIKTLAIVLSLTFVISYKNLINENQQIKKELVEQYKITRQIDYTDGIYLDENNNIQVDK